MNPKGRPPIIILGCPRSGTSILTRMLIDLGVFMGDKMDILPTGEVSPLKSQGGSTSGAAATTSPASSNRSSTPAKKESN